MWPEDDPEMMDRPPPARDPNDDSLTCGECGLHVSLDEAERTGWRLYSDGLGELLPFCAECDKREFGDR